MKEFLKVLIISTLVSVFIQALLYYFISIRAEFILDQADIQMQQAKELFYEICTSQK